VEVTVHMKVAGPPDGYPLLVIPWRGFEVDYFRPYFHGVEEFCRVFYVRMPQIGDYKGLARHGDSNLVRYPTELLSKALADLMKDSGLETFGLLAHGPDASVLGMMLAGENPERVTHLVLINPRSAGDVYSGSIENVRRHGLKVGSKEIVKGADSISLQQDGNPKYKAADSGEAGGLNRALNNLRYADPTEPETGSLGYLYRLPGGVQVLNDNSWSAKSILGSSKVSIPTIIFMGERSPWTPVGDMTLVAGLFNRPRIVKLADAGEMPFISHTYVFTKYLENLFQNVTKKKKKSSGRTGR
jgi:pimeloyl-ACP methyl ester carboxylesterase